MSDLQTEVNRLVHSFVARLTDIARQAAIHTLESAFASPASLGGSVRGRPPGRGGGKRTPEDLKALSERFTSFVKSNPGLRIEQINKQLGTRTKDLILPIHKLFESGEISSKGKKRSTIYFAGKKRKS